MWEPGWLIGRNEQSVVGIFPSHCVRVVNVNSLYPALHTLSSSISTHTVEAEPVPEFNDVIRVRVPETSVKSRIGLYSCFCN